MKGEASFLSPSLFWRYGMLIATISAAFPYDLMDKILKHPLVGAVRFNTGVPSPDSAYDTLVHLKSKTDKIIWIDLKCRQLRIAHWAAPYYGEIVLNHEIEAELPAHIHLRGAEEINITAVRGCKIYLEHPPKYAVGQGQSVNIHAKSLKIKGFFTKEDKKYIYAANNLGMHYFMLSFYEGKEDIDALNSRLKNPKEAQIGLKIESKKGLNALDYFSKQDNLHLVLARDDLLINLDDFPLNIMDATGKCIEIDEKSIAASHLFMGFEHTGIISAADISDICLLYFLKYSNFMLSDGICLNHFDKAIAAWQMFLELKEREES
jgi:hypothetical protein